MSSALNKVNPSELEKLAEYVSKVVSKESGNVLGLGQRSMVISRMTKRLLDLGGFSVEEYMMHFEKNFKSELAVLTGSLTTHHTFFFREFSHFEYLLKNIDPIIKRVQARGERTLNILSAACSRGHEVYSLATFFKHHLTMLYPEMNFKITGIDIDQESVKFAQNGVYPFREVIGIPKVYLEGNWQRGTAEIADYAKIKSHIREHCHFFDENFLTSDLSRHNKKYDIIFCRNVFIYFDNLTIQNACLQFKKILHKDALFITGVSESLKDIVNLKFHSFGSNIYSFDLPVKLVDGPSVVGTKGALARPVETKKKVIRMLCVDDSPSILKILTKVFTSDPDFELVGTAMNGILAQEFLKNNKVDAMTLDIHMPEMDGVEYLKKNFGPNHPLVVMVSSASREDSTFALKALQHGASDFVEKPALDNMAERSEEIKMKIKSGYFSKVITTTTFETEFKNDFKIKEYEKKARILFANFSDIERINKIIGDLKSDQPPFFIIFEGNGNFMEVISSKVSTHNNFIVKNFEQANGNFKANCIYLCDFKKDFPGVSKFIESKVASVSVLGGITKFAEQKIIQLKNVQLLLDDVDWQNKDLRKMSTDIFPWTSFGHVGTEYLAKK